ncbi:extracellular solute-binding protein family 1 [Kribbella flavida DSM 17836]|uniref:Extracellular solute-binding protein family 1 n=1 Tax=Kribbella flavida (strain DSM 17836 / JCM 10339 / NBRC 14399) TaxID=479435 RepID=D2Q241_KRIFD|nr:sugar ABC transporter substrate-binding protein [Kribbella flavida]ADB33987.1 extracellular solute-binding protein family 1 [Kribbella flavida DSM 17836]
MRISPRRAAAALSAMALVGSLSACGGDDSAGDAGAPLEFWTRSGPEGATTYKAILAAFTAKTGIQVNYQGVLEFDTQLQTKASSKKLPDLWVNDASLLGTYQGQGYTTPVEPGQIEGGDAIDAATWQQNKGLDGQLYGVPYSRQAFGTLVRVDWRKKLGLPQPKTWDDLTALATAFATKDPDGNGKKDTYGMVVPGSSKNGYIGWWGISYIWQAGGDILAPAGEGKYKSVINSPQTRTGLEFIRRQFCTPGNVVPGSLNLTTSEAPFFQEGKAGIYLTGPYAFGTYDKILGKDKYEVVPMPKGPVSTTTLGDGENIYFGAGSQKSDEAKKLAAFLISPEGQEIGMKAEESKYPTVRLPVNRGVDVHKVLGDPRWDLIQKQYLDDTKTFVWSIKFQPIRQALGEGVNAMMSSCDSDLDAGLKKLDQAITAELKAQDVLG